MSARVVFQMVVYQSDFVLDAVLAAIAPFGEIICTEGPVAFYAKQGARTSTDNTNAILEKYVPARNIVRGQFAEKDEMMNAAIHLVPDDTEFLWMIDADECYNPETITAILAQLDNYDSVELKPLTFFGGFERCIGGYELRAQWFRIQRWYRGARWASHRPPTILAPDGKAWRKHRHWDAPYTFEHFSYVLPSQVKAKIAYYDSWNAGVIRDYFPRVFKRWVLGDAEERQDIENLYDGVHEFNLSRRGDARTYPFTGEHPPEIQRIMPALQERFEREVEEMREGRI